MKAMVLFGVFLVSLNLAAWQKDGVPVCTAPGLQWRCKAEPLMAGRVAITWEDGRSDTLSKVYLQVLDSLGNPLFTKDGIRVSQRGGTEVYHQMVTNGSDIFITWEGAPGSARINTDIFVTKIDGLTGVKKWDDIPVCTADGDQMEPQFCLDGSGEGCYVTWTDYRSSHAGVWAARVTAQGQVAWEAPVCSLAGNQGTPVAVKSGDGCIIFWGDSRHSLQGIYGQRLTPDSSSGQWGANGKLIIPFHSSNVLHTLDEIYYGDQVSYFFPYAVGDDRGGAVVSDNFGYNGLSQRVDSLGNLLWSSPPNVTPPPYCFISDKASGIIGAVGNWRLDPIESNSSVCELQLDSLGKTLWGQHPLSVWEGPLDTAQFRTFPTLTDDSHHGAVMTWVENDYTGNKLLITRVDSGGQVRWQSPSVICDLFYAKDHPFIINGPNQGYIVVWEDARNSNTDLYAQYVDSTGQLGINEIAAKELPSNEGLLSIEPNPFSRTATIKYALSVKTKVSLKIYDVTGKQVRKLVGGEQEAGFHTVNWDGKDDKNQSSASGVYFYRLETKEFKSTKKVVQLK